MNWEKDGSSLEIRTQGQLPDGRPALDPISFLSGASVHLEQMAHDHWWMGLEAGGKYFHPNFGVQDGPACGCVCPTRTMKIRNGKATAGRGRHLEENERPIDRIVTAPPGEPPKMFVDFGRPQMDLM